MREKQIYHSFKDLVGKSVKVTFVAGFTQTGILGTDEEGYTLTNEKYQFHFKRKDVKKYEKYA